MRNTHYSRGYLALGQLLIILFLVFWGSANASVSFEELQTSAFKNNPDLKKSFHQWQKSIRLKDAAGALPDPTLSFDYFIDEVQTRTGPQEYRLMLAQRLPWFGKRGLEADIASLNAEKALLQIETTKLQLTLSLAKVWATGINTQHQISIAHEELGLLKQIERLALIRYRHAKAGHPDLIRVQVNRGKLENKLDALHLQLNNSTDELERLINSPLASSFEWPIDLHNGNGTTPINIKAILTQIENNPNLQALSLETEIQKKRVERTALKSRPDFTLKYGRIFTDEAINPDMDGSGDDPQFIGIGVNIPIWSQKNNGLTAAAHEQNLVNEQALSSFRASLIKQLKKQLHLIDTSTKQLSRYRAQLIPQAETALTALLKSYQTGNSNFSELLETEKALLELRQHQFELMVNQWLANKTIRSLIGADL